MSEQDERCELVYQSPLMAASQLRFAGLDDQKVKPAFRPHRVPATRLPFWATESSQPKSS